MELSFKNYAKRFVSLMFGFVLCAYGIALTVNAHLGLSPWDVLYDGGAKQLTKLLDTQVMIGTLSQIIGFMVLAVDVFMKEKIGIGTILNIVLIGHFINLFLKYDLAFKSDVLVLRFVFMALGFIILGFGIYFYMKAGFGAGPRDSFMLALARRGASVPMARNSMDFAAFVVGVALGGEYGIGTVVSVFIMGYILKYVFRLFKFDMTQVKHETVFDTLKNIKTLLSKNGQQV
jgi:uncharacterized membrane protein YczE